jgi:membrane-bound serine protease (ClpP class)
MTSHPSVPRVGRAAIALGLVAGGVALLGAQAAAPPPSLAPASQQPQVSVVVAEVDGIIHPVSAEYVLGAIEQAERTGAAAVVIVLRTPGGLLDSTRTITSRMIAARVPVVVFIAPSGSRAASAGFLITLAADVAAMAPGTSLGAAHPVAANGAPADETMAKKSASDVAAYARSLAEKRGRNVDLAQQAVIESRAFTDEEARTASPPLVDIVARDLDDLIRQLDGRPVKRFDGSTAEMQTGNARVDRVEWTWRQQLLSAIAHPQVAYLLFSLGTLGLTIELWNPGAILPGVVGGLCLLLAFFAFQVLPVNYAGLLLILFGILLLVLEIKVVSYGLLAVGGIVSLVLGAVFLIDSPLPELQIGLRLILPVALGVSALVLGLVRLAVRAQRLRSVTGTSGMVGSQADVVVAVPPEGRGQVATHGEIWAATAAEPIEVGARVEVTSVDGLVLHVRRWPASH